MPALNLPFAFPTIRRSRSARPTSTVGQAGVPIFNGYIEERETDPGLTTHAARHKTFTDILVNTSIVAAGVRYYINLVGGAEWTFTPADADTDSFYAELAEAMLTEHPLTSWTRIIRRAAMYRFWGFSTQEWTAVRRPDGWFSFLDIAPRAQVTIERWDVDDKGVVHGAIQRPPNTYTDIYLPRQKLLYVVDDSLNDSPQGLGLFRQLVAPAKSLARYEQLEGMGFETDLRGIPIGRAPIADMASQIGLEGGITKEIFKTMLAPIEDFVRNHIRSAKLGMLLDSAMQSTADESERPSNARMWDIELLQGDSTSFAENAAAIERKNYECARIIGVEQLLLGSGEVGSYALSKDKTHAFYLLVDGALKAVREAVKTDLLGTLWRLNGWPEEMMPEIATEAVSYTDVEQIAATLRDMATAGNTMAPDDPAIPEVRELMGLSAPTEESVAAAMAAQAAAEKAAAAVTEPGFGDGGGE